jgi:hypothetical protein
MDRAALEALGREDLVVEARRFGVKRPEVMTRVELVDEVLRLATPNPVERKEIRGWLGVARDLLASAVERGLNLPDAAAMIRGDVRFVPLHPVQPPVATVTLAEIYGAQGHFDRALRMLDEVLDREDDHEVARRLRVRLVADRDAKRAREKERAGEAPAAPQDGSASALPADEPAVGPEEETDPTRLAPGWAESAEAAVSSALHGLGAGDDAEPPTLPPEADLATLPPAADPATLMPAPDHATLMPAPLSTLDIDAPDHATLIPARPETSELGAEEKPDHVTLMPARPDVAVLGYDELEQEQLIPSEATPAAIDAEGAVKASVPASEVAASGDGQADGANADQPSGAAVVFARTGIATASVYFEVGDLATSDGQVLVLRVVEHRSRAEGVERVERDLPVTDRRGTATILDLEGGSVLRAALGRKWDGEFRAAAVGAEVRVVPEGIDVTWAPRHDVDYVAVAGRSGLGIHVVV